MRHPCHDPVIDAIGSGHHTTPDIARVTGLSRSALWWRLFDLRHAGVIRAERISGRGRGQHKAYRLNPWSAKP